MHGRNANVTIICIALLALIPNLQWRLKPWGEVSPCKAQGDYHILTYAGSVVLYRAVGRRTETFLAMDH